MSTVLHSLIENWRRRLAWSNSGRSWEERLGALALVAAAGCTYWFGRKLERSQQVVLWGLLLVGLVIVLRRGWVKLFGPVLFYDLIRLARRGRYAFLRCVYALLLLLMLSSVYTSHETRRAYSVGTRASEMASLGESFFTTFFVVQFLAVGLLTPAYVAGAICEEKERKTLEFLLATDLRNREIVLSKLASRLANLSLLILTGLPILSFTQFLGGVDPDLVLAGFAATGLTMLGLAGLSVLCSVYARKARTAIVLTYALMAIYFACSGLALAVLSWYPAIASLSLPFASVPFTIQNLMGALNAGNPLVVLSELERALSSGQPLADVVPGLLRSYVLFHGLVAVSCSAWAVLRLRAVFLHETYEDREARRRKSRLLPGGRRPRVSDHPMVWKEVFADGGLALNWFGRIVLGILVVGSFVPIVWMEVYYYFNQSSAPSRVMETNAYVRIVGTIVAIIALLGVALRASSSVSGERDRQTWDSLLTTPLESNAILFGKWIGSVLSVRWAAVWLAAIWLVGFVTGGLSLLAIPLLMSACLIYAGFLALLGLWFSASCRTTLRANLSTLAVTGILGGGYWLLFSCCIPLFQGAGPGAGIEDLLQFLALGMTPPITLGFLAFTSEEMVRAMSAHNPPIEGKLIGFSILGLLCWAVAAVVAWGVASTHLRAATGREVKYPHLTSLDEPPRAPPLPRDEAPVER
jgi:ABC-type transport system involved in multi-copper enzyme maturation permease subunit